VADLSILNPSIASYTFATLAFAAFGIHLALGRRGGTKAALLLAAVCVSALWAAVNLAYSIAPSEKLWTARTAADGLRVAGWLAFAILLLYKRLAWWLAGLLAIPAALCLLPQLTPGIMLAVSVAGLVLTEQLFRRAPHEVRWSIKPLCIALGGSFFFDLYVYADGLLLGRLDADLSAARGIAQALVIPFIAIATARNKDWTIDIALSRGMVFHSTAILACGLYLLAVAGAGYYVRYFSGSWGKAFQAGFIFAAVLVLGWLFSSGALRARLRVFINKNFFSYRYDYREEWLRFTGLLGQRDAGANAPQRCILALANLVESPAGALWARDAQGGYGQTARWNFPPVEQRADAALPGFLAKTGWVIDLEDYAEQPLRYAGLALPQWLLRLPSAWLVIPILAQQELIGFVVLASPRTRVEVNWEVRDLLKTAARQVGSFLAETRASEALLEARQFEAFNKMSAFVVHDLKNLVAQLSLLLANAERHRHNPRFQDDMLSTVRHVSERMHKLLLQLSAGSRAEEPLKPVALTALALRIARDKAAERSDISVTGMDDVHVLAHEQRLERVLGHLVQNAIDATRESGQVRVAVCAAGSEAVVEVTDSGCGMSEDFVRERLFRPFQTTKASGMGIGAFETAQVVREMGGSIETESKPGAGTRIRVILPMHFDHSSRQQPAREAA
jgi:putative PEP-CTERM system histidine kinase